MVMSIMYLGLVLILPIKFLFCLSSGFQKSLLDLLEEIDFLYAVMIYKIDVIDTHIT